MPQRPGCHGRAMREGGRREPKVRRGSRPAPQSCFLNCMRCAAPLAAPSAHGHGSMPRGTMPRAWIVLHARSPWRDAEARAYSVIRHGRRRPCREFVSAAPAESRGRSRPVLVSMSRALECGSGALHVRECVAPSLYTTRTKAHLHPSQRARRSQHTRCSQSAGVSYLNRCERISIKDEASLMSTSYQRRRVPGATGSRHLRSPQYRA